MVKIDIFCKKRTFPNLEPLGHVRRLPVCGPLDQALFKSCDAVIVPSRNEPFGIVVLEAHGRFFQLDWRKIVGVVVFFFVEDLEGAMKGLFFFRHMIYLISLCVPGAAHSL